ncbi:Germin-like protein subfamily 1 member 7 [Hibiscus syriacus]|uniref:Germin-like protein n=1 Tax=Hibiscus syriacus TaxID=106335 RepID=A0A6A2X6B0_HIBSY|nr:germin-like protein subfamily 1 member 7 [Hibiscus syriacus]KAE8670438.1 Germin-like protein subfamily 1 member 7 [Hibiscus syriacus]
MKGVHFLVAFVLLALALAFVSASDPSPLQDFCVATNDDNGIDGIFVNGKFCKDPSLATPEDFFLSRLNNPGDTFNQVGSVVTLANDEKIPGLNTLAISIARIDFSALGGQHPPHIHPRATEILVVLEGTLRVGFVTSSPDNRLFTKELNPGDVFVFPVGLIHFQENIGSGGAVALAAFNSQNPGDIAISDAVFGSDPPIDPEVLAKAFRMDKNVVHQMQLRS